MPPDLDAQQRAFAELIIRGGVNLQPGEALRLTAELGQRDFVRVLATAAYQAGCRYVDVRWLDPLTTRARYEHLDPQYIEYLPNFEIASHQEMLDTNWVLVALSGTEYPDAYENVNPARMRRERVARAQKLEFFSQRVMNNEISWCVAAAPTIPWAQKVFPDLPPEAGLEHLWELILRVCRSDQADPLLAWKEHDARLKKIVAFMDTHQVRSIRYLDRAPGPDGRPATDLTVGLTDWPLWSAGSALTKQGRAFFSNIPTEEVFSTPHNQRTNGWARTSKPGFPFEREVSGAFFRFANGEVVEWQAQKGQEVLDQLFEIPGARRLGELALVDNRSPISQSGLIFHDVLFDENAASHIAFGRAYPEGVNGGSTMSQEVLQELGVNHSDAHEDLMIGTPTMQVSGTCADGSQVLIMDHGQFVDDVLA